MLRSGQANHRIIGCAAFLLSVAAARAAQTPWASHVVSYVPGTTPVAGYADPATTLGAPERFSGETDFGGVYASVVSMFNPAWGTDELVSLGEGGSLILELDTPATDDPAHLYGADLIILGNGGFADAAWPAGRINDPALLLGTETMRVSVSTDGQSFVALGDYAEGLFPTQGFLDGGPYDTSPGSLPSDFLKPMNPALTLADFAGLTYAQALALYDGSGGGTPIDIAAAGLPAVRYVRIDVLDDGDADTMLHAEIEALATVPEPATMVLLALAGVSGLVRGRGR